MDSARAADCDDPRSARRHSAGSAGTSRLGRDRGNEAECTWASWTLKLRSRVLTLCYQQENNTCVP